MNKKYKVIIAGGGTGGHIFPAVAIANALTKIMPEVRILFVGAKGRMEMQKVPEAGYKIIGLPVIGIQRKLSFKNFIVPFKLIKSLLIARIILKRFKPNAVIGVGGYASAPVSYMASLLKIPVLLQEQNSFPGLTNKILAKKADRICVAYEGMEKYFPKEKILVTGNPIRQNIKNIGNKKNKAILEFGLNETRKTLLVIGGSLGAYSINKAIHNSIEMLTANNIQIIWQTGINYYETAQSSTKNIEKGSVVTTKFIKQMDLAYAASDIIVSRAGAITVSELCLVKKPVILVPSPNVAEDHQTKNAMILVNNGAAIIVKDNETYEKLGKTIIELVKDEQKQLSLSNGIAKLALPNADEIIAGEVIKLFK